MNSDQHQDMPDPLDVKPGEKIQTSSTVASEVTTKTKFKLWRYMLPMAINLLLFVLVQAVISNACSQLDDGVRGECGAAWIGFLLVMPIEVLVFTICFIIMLIGIYRWAKQR